MTSNSQFTHELQLSIPAEHACYNDHFPGNPLVPGALLLQWIIAKIEMQWGVRVNLIKQIKFLNIVRPADELRLLVNVSSETGVCSLNAFVGESEVCKGMLSTVAERDHE
jgi:3-hydroxyacyl-[acyl-carrier-protein] dehydratase